MTEQFAKIIRKGIVSGSLRMSVLREDDSEIVVLVMVKGESLVVTFPKPDWNLCSVGQLDELLSMASSLKRRP